MQPKCGEAGPGHGFPASMLTDNAVVFAGAPQAAAAPSSWSWTPWGLPSGTPCLSPADLRQGGTRPPDPQTLARQATNGRNVAELHAQLGRFAGYDNHHRRTGHSAAAPQPALTPHGPRPPRHRQASPFPPTGLGHPGLFTVPGK